MIFDVPFGLSILPILLRGAIVTVYITAASFVACLVGGLVILGLRRIHILKIGEGVTLLADFVRSTPVLVQVYFLYFLLPDMGLALSPIATGIIVLSVHYSCYVAEAYRAGLEAVPRGQWEAAIAVGLRRRVIYLRVIIPQAVRPIVPLVGNYLVYMFKDTPLLAAISVSEMMFKALEIGANQFRYFEPITLCGVLFLFMSLAASRLTSVLEKKIGWKWKRQYEAD